jgi:hypothetical protein
MVEANSSIVRLPLKLEAPSFRAERITEVRHDHSGKTAAVSISRTEFLDTLLLRLSITRFYTLNETSFDFEVLQKDDDEKFKIAKDLVFQLSRRERDEVTESVDRILTMFDLLNSEKGESNKTPT